MIDLNKKILITGGTGFVGAYLIQLLVQKGYRNIYVLKGQKSDISLLSGVLDKINFVEGNLLDFASLEAAISGKHQIYHCAAMVSFDPKDAEKMKKINVEGTTAMVNLSLDAGVEKFLHVSSVAALGRTTTQLITDEKTPWQRDAANTTYSLTKFLAEQEVWRGVAEGLNAAIINPSIIIGSGFWKKGTCAFFPKIYKGLKFCPKGSTGFVDVRDVARMAVQLMESDINGERFICNGINTSYRSFFDLMGKYMNRKSPSIMVSKQAALAFAWFDWIRTKITGGYPLVTPETARASSSTHSFNAEKSVKLLDFEYTPFEKTIADTSQQYLQSLEAQSKWSVLSV